MKRRFIKVVFILITVFVALSSVTVYVNNNLYENKKVYKLKVGEEFEIYASTNSCCRYCLGNEYDLVHLDYIGKHIVKSSGPDCVGCNVTRAYTFRTKSAGQDSVILNFVVGGGHCADPMHRKEKYQVQIE